MIGLQRLAIFAALFFFLGGGFTPLGLAAGGSSTSAQNDAPIFIPVDRITVAVFRDGEVAQHLIFILKLEITDRNASNLVIEKMPRLTDAFMRDLHALASAPSAAQDGLDMVQAKRRLLASSVRVLGPNVVRNVLIDRSIVRKLS
jgi:flagellar basal body-associated protein FliL